MFYLSIHSQLNYAWRKCIWFLSIHKKLNSQQELSWIRLIHLSKIQNENIKNTDVSFVSD